MNGRKQCYEQTSWSRRDETWQGGEQVVKQRRNGVMAVNGRRSIRRYRLESTKGIS